MDDSVNSRVTAPRAAREVSVGDGPTLRAEAQRKRFRSGDVILRRYRIVDELGQGGMGVVYRCFDQIGGIEVALKALPPELSHNSVEMEEIRENFRLVEGLHHPNIAAAKTLERDEVTGDTYLVMECVVGVNLRQWRKQRGKLDTGSSKRAGEHAAAGAVKVGPREPLAGCRTLDEALPVLRQVAAALDFAHSRKIIHRDVKPSNVMLSADGTVKVLDFGLAAQIHTSMSRVSRVHYGTSGTGPYMAPEQWRGQRQGARTDQYALAVMAYELLAGELPFENSDAAVLREAVLKEPVGVIAGLEKRVWLALQRALAKEPADRFEDCGTFVAALSGECGQGVASSGKRLLLALAAALVALACASAWFFRTGGTPPEKVREVSEPAAGAVTNAVLPPPQDTGSVARAEEAALPATNLVSEAEVGQRYATAKTCYDNALNVKDGQGFTEEKDRLKEAWNAAQRYDEAKNWDLALAGYNTVVKRYEEMKQADLGRTSAEKRKQAAASARQTAEASGAAKDAKEVFERGASEFAKATALFEGGTFAKAEEAWQAATDAFSTAAKRADSVRGWRQSESLLDGELGKVDKKLLGQYGGGQLEEVMRLQDAGKKSAGDPEKGAKFFEDARAKLLETNQKVQKNLPPALEIVVEVDGQRVGAKVSDGREISTAPCTYTLCKGTNYVFEVSYQPAASKVRYRSVKRAVTANWNGLRTDVLTLVAEEGLQEGGPWVSPGVGMEFVWIEKMKIWAGKYEVTNEEYRKKEPAHISEGYKSISLDGDRLPVVCVSFAEARAYAVWLTDRDKPQLGGLRYRLPTEKEWLALAQCGDGREYPWGTSWPPVSGQAGNYHGQEGAGGGTWKKIDGYDDGAPAACEVEKSWANPWGLYGLGGNVWECCASNADAQSFGAWLGASWLLGNADFLRCDGRNILNVVGNERDYSSGFRLILTR